MKAELQKIKTEVREVLVQNILPFWSGKMIDDENGGFFGQITGNDQIVPIADKGGILNAWELSGNRYWLQKAQKCWAYISEKLVDPSGGEWFWRISDAGNVNRNDDKAGFWKCPYHNSRMCLELMMRANVEN